MKNILISVPDTLATRMRASIPTRQRSKTIARLIDEEVKKREKLLYDCARAVEAETALSKEMEEWNGTLNDGIQHESW
ncbi:MAG: hypothetical protein JO131_01365 [Gammaproteobacteria bacterium]|nr:hypothetical protein [Gammaproteobacteria bacterium]